MKSQSTYETSFLESGQSVLKGDPLARFQPGYITLTRMLRLAILSNNGLCANVSTMANNHL